MKQLRPVLLKLYWVAHAQFGIDPLKAARSLLRLPWFFRDYRRFRRGYDGAIELQPCLHDCDQTCGATADEYFWQDLIVARMIHAARPERHVDIGSRIDGFVAHVASFREIEVLDIRPMDADVPGVVSSRLDVSQLQADLAGSADSVSCLHALEHFGLGRYGDPVDHDGFDRGLANIAAIVRPGGRLYLSVPIGRERVVFNANRVSDPRRVLRLAASHGLSLYRLLTVDEGGRTVKEVPHDEARLSAIARKDYALGIFVFDATGNVPV